MKRSGTKRGLDFESFEERRLLAVLTEIYEPCELDFVSEIKASAIKDSFLPGGPLDAPMIVDMKVGSAKWTIPFLEHIDSPARIGFPMNKLPNQLNSLPWTNVDQVFIQFSKDVGASFDKTDVKVTGVQTLDYTSQLTVSYNASRFLATLKFLNPLGLEKLRIVILDTVTDAAGNRLDGEWVNGGTQSLSGNGTAGGKFDYRINVLPGDVSGNGIVLGNDVTLDVLARGKSTLDGASFNPLADLDGSGNCVQADVDSVVARRLTLFPTNEPPANIDSQLARSSNEVSSDEGHSALGLASTSVSTIEVVMPVETIDSVPEIVLETLTAPDTTLTPVDSDLLIESVVDLLTSNLPHAASATELSGLALTELAVYLPAPAALIGAQLSASTSPIGNPAPLVQELLNGESLTDSIERKQQRGTELRRGTTSLVRQRT